MKASSPSKPNEYTLILKFPRGSEVFEAAFAFGFEAGVVWEKLRDLAAEDATTDVQAYLHDENRETFMRMAEAVGWDVKFSPFEAFGLDGYESATFSNPKAGLSQ